MSFLTAIMQVTSRTEGLPLDDMTLRFNVQNSCKTEDFPAAPEKGAFINGFFLEGATWEFGRNGEQGYLVDQVLKDLHPEMPIIHVTSILRTER